MTDQLAIIALIYNFLLTIFLPIHKHVCGFVNVKFLLITKICIILPFTSFDIKCLPFFGDNIWWPLCIVIFQNIGSHNGYRLCCMSQKT